ncbi:MAG: (2Fe-2S)-binding protein [Chlorobiaceae bacterium]|nr:(2Fe-2S)-binding protein [Chlorobiaceae bacterium]NTV15988.1 (2Fe-2S)-binding protein [Chlorobiaceae bacterium]
MIIFINDKPCEAKTGDLLLKVAQHHKCHIGYICGGNGICQSCFVYVKEGMECLSPPTKIEKAFISDKLFQEGGRLGCQSVIVKEGNLRVLSRAEHLRRLVIGLNVPGFVIYAQTIGYNVVNKLPEGAGNLFDRVKKGQMNPGDSLGKIGNGLVQASQLAASTIMETFPFLQYPATILAEGGKGVLNSATDFVCNASGGRLHLPGTTCSCCETEKTPVIEPVKISVK